VAEFVDQGVFIVFRIKYFLQAMFDVRCWFRNHRASRQWDAELRLALQERIVILDTCTAKVGNHTLWIANHPYAAGHRWEYLGDLNDNTIVLPSRTTVMELRDVLQKNILIQVIDGSLPANFKFN
jgi:hypothetical protein